jgi:hypothetical protein
MAEELKRLCVRAVERLLDLFGMVAYPLVDLFLRVADRVVSMSQGGLSWPIPLRRGLFWWVVVIPALSLVIAFIADRGGQTAVLFLLVILGIVVFALVGGAAADGAPPGVLSGLWLFGACPLVMALAAAGLGNGGYAVLRGEPVDAVVEKVNKFQDAGRPRTAIARLSDPTTKEVLPLPTVSFKESAGYYKLAGYGNYKIGDRVVVLAVRGSDHPVVLVEQASRFTGLAAMWLVPWLIGLGGVVVKLGPGGRAKQISREANVEVRRTMIERYGLERYLRAADATKLDEVHEPPFPGLLGARLWRVDMGRGEPLCIVELVNSTPEPDGSAKSYMLQVPPDMETAHQAVAWTFGMAEHEYHPAVES